jgi:hypothetical protein
LKSKLNSWTIAEPRNAILEVVVVAFMYYYMLVMYVIAYSPKYVQVCQGKDGVHEVQ